MSQPATPPPPKKGYLGPKKCKNGSEKRGKTLDEECEKFWTKKTVFFIGLKMGLEI